MNPYKIILESLPGTIIGTALFFAPVPNDVSIWFRLCQSFGFGVAMWEGVGVILGLIWLIIYVLTD